MKVLFTLLSLFFLLASHAQKGKEIPQRKTFPATLYEHSNFTGQAKALTAGKYLLSDFNDITSSIKVSPGYVVLIYEHADAGGGYGKWTDLLESQADLNGFGFNDITSYINIFPAKREGFYYVRNTNVNGQFVPGHWERERANQPEQKPNLVVTVAPALPPNVKNTTETVLQYNGPTTTIATLGSLNDASRYLWERAENDQLGIIGNDFRGIEELGSACFQRESHNTAIPDNFNFWFLQKQRNDHRAKPYFKRTLVGTLLKSRQVNIAGTYEDYDINIDIIPDPKFQYLLTEAHPPDYTTIMALQWQGSKLNPSNLLTKPAWAWEGSAGQADCDEDKRKGWQYLEAEIATEDWPQGDHKFGRSRFTDLCLINHGKKMAVYGPWIYDAGHCCHPEIHPAEQAWWREGNDQGIKYNLNVFCDASKRFWWRRQMDDGTKLHPWGAPPVKGLFAIAFSVPLGSAEANINKITKKFEVANIEDYNVAQYPNTNQVYNLVYQGRTLVTFLPHNNSFRVTFENVGLDGDNVKGFLVIETSVGTVTQIATEIYVPVGTGVVKVTLPPNSDPDHVDQRYEERFFKKVDGRYMFTIMQTTINNSEKEILR